MLANSFALRTPSEYPDGRRSAASAGRAKACTPGYYNREGQANATTRQGSFFFGTPTEYSEILEASRTHGPPQGFEVS